MSIPGEIEPHLGQMFDWELANRFKISHSKARNYRVEAGIPPVCKVCRRAAIEGTKNPCVTHSVEAKERKEAALLEVREAALQESAQPLLGSALVAGAAEIRGQSANVNVRRPQPLAQQFFHNWKRVVRAHALYAGNVL